MRRTKLIGSMASTLVASFLFLYSVSVFASVKNYPQGPGIMISKSDQQPVPPNNQSPFEENQEEASDEFQNTVSLVCLLEESLSLISVASPLDVIHHFSYAEAISAHVPIYLATRSLLI